MHMNIRIAYCEDEKIQAEYANDLIKQWMSAHQIGCHVDTFDSAEAFLFKLDEQQTLPYDLVLLDIAMSGMDGFSLAEKLRQRDKQVHIVFLTSDPSRVFDGYKINIWRYILKPLDSTKITELFNDFMKELQSSSARTYVSFEISGENVRMALEDIEYIEVFGHYTTLHGTKETYTLKESFVEVLKKINEVQADTMMKCHRSVAVNLAKVVRIGRQSCTLESGKELPVSRSMYAGINAAFIHMNL